MVFTTHRGKTHINSHPFPSSASSSGLAHLRQVHKATWTHLHHPRGWPLLITTQAVDSLNRQWHIGLGVRLLRWKNEDLEENGKEGLGKKKGWLGLCRAGGSVIQGAAGSRCHVVLGCQTDLRTVVPLSNAAGHWWFWNNGCKVVEIEVAQGTTRRLPRVRLNLSSLPWRHVMQSALLRTGIQVPVALGCRQFSVRQVWELGNIQLPNSLCYGHGYH